MGAEGQCSDRHGSAKPVAVTGVDAIATLSQSIEYIKRYLRIQIFVNALYTKHAERVMYGIRQAIASHSQAYSCCNVCGLCTARHLTHSLLLWTEPIAIVSLSL